MTRLSEIEAVFFDAAGTLFHVRGSVGRIYSDIARRFGVETEPEALDRAFGKVLRCKSAFGLPANAIADARAEEKRWWSEIVAAVLAGRMTSGVFRDYFDEVFEFFRTKNAWELYPDTKPALEELRNLGYRLGIISNFDTRLLNLLADLELDGFFEQVTLSWTAGAAKPDSRIFLSAVQSMRLAPHKAAHIGDSIEEDVEGARKAGLHGILLDRDGSHPAANLLRIDSLSEIYRLLRQ